MKGKMREETFPQKKKKVFGIIIICIALTIILFATTRTIENYGPGQDPKAKFDDLRAPITSTSEQPPIDRHNYLMHEKKIINEHVASKGLIFTEYKKDFVNTAKKNYDIEARFADMSRDFEGLAEEIESARTEIQSFRPADGETKQHQADVLGRLDRLHAKLMEYKNHIRAPKDTANYLDECQYEFRRLMDIT